MKSNICTLGKDKRSIEAVLSEVEKVTAYNGLEAKKSLRIRLLAEELCGMLPGLVDKFDGIFWAENTGKAYELHVKLMADSMSADTRDALLAVSKSGKNQAAKGFMGKVRAVAESFILNMDSNVASDLGAIYSWSLLSYRQSVSTGENNAARDELEQSIVAKLADDVTVGVSGRSVEIVVKKAF